MWCVSCVCADIQYSSTLACVIAQSFHCTYAIYYTYNMELKPSELIHTAEMGSLLWFRYTRQF